MTPVDARRYPHYGGRTRPHTCAACERIVLCFVTDGPLDGVPLCLTCLTDIATADPLAPPKGVVPGSAVMWAYIDEDCPARGPALSHTQNGAPVCVHCGTRLLHRQKTSS